MRRYIKKLKHPTKANNTLYSDDYRKNYIKTGPLYSVNKVGENGKISVDWEAQKNKKLYVVDLPYAKQKEYWISKILSHPHYGKMLVNQEGTPKTNTTEARYAALRRMIKKGVVIKRGNYLMLPHRKING